MSTKTTIKSIAAAGLVSLLSLFPKKSNAQTIQTNTPLPDFRVRTEYSGDADQNHKIQSTLGIAPANIYNGMPVENLAQFFETFRVYDVLAENKEKDTHFTALGARIQNAELAGIKSDLLFFGVIDDDEGFATETSHKLTDKLKLTLNAERNLVSDSTRLGGAISYQLNPKLQTTVGFDHLNFGKNETDQYLVNLIYDITKNEMVGIAAVVSDNGKSTDFGAGIAYLHYGKNDQWGIRARARFDQHDTSNGNGEFKSCNGEIILAQKPTTYRPGASWILGRNADTDDMYNRSVVPLTVSKTEGVDLNNRAEYGFSFTVRGEVTENSQNTVGSIVGGIGYTLPANKVLPGTLGFTTEYQHDFAPSAEKDSLNAGLFYKVGPIEAKIKTSVPVSASKSQNQPTVFASIQAQF